MKICNVTELDKDTLAKLRVLAMRESLDNVGRFDAERARMRFTDSFSVSDTKKVLLNNELVGCYVLKHTGECLYLDHLYFYPKWQNLGMGGKILSLLKNRATEQGLSLRLGALKHSRANDFYKKHCFRYTHEEEWDCYYEFTLG